MFRKKARRNYINLCSICVLQNIYVNHLQDQTYRCKNRRSSFQTRTFRDQHLKLWTGTQVTMLAGACARTLIAWWTVDLEETFHLTGIKIYNIHRHGDKAICTIAVVKTFGLRAKSSKCFCLIYRMSLCLHYCCSYIL